MKTAMRRLSIPPVVLAAMVTSVAFVVMEFLVEGLVWLLFKVTEADLLSRTFGVTLSGLRYYSVNIMMLLGGSIVMMWVYALIRRNFDTMGRAVIVTSAVALLLMTIPGASLANTGVLTVELVLLSLALDLVELPVAVLFGAGAYEMITDL